MDDDVLLLLMAGSQKRNIHLGLDSSFKCYKKTFSSGTCSRNVAWDFAKYIFSVTQWHSFGRHSV